MGLTGAIASASLNEGLRWILDREAAAQSAATEGAQTSAPTSGGQSVNIDGSGNTVNQSGDTNITINNPPTSRSPDYADELDQLSGFVMEAGKIQDAFVQYDDGTELIKSRYHDWNPRVLQYLQAQLGASYAVQFENAPAVEAGTGYFHDRSIKGSGYWREIERKKRMLNSFIAELRSASR